MAMFGIDTSKAASESFKNQARSLIGGDPSFWGRYFNGTLERREHQYSPSENAVLNRLQIPVLCFARQMWAVSDHTHARAHATENMKGVIDAFGAQYLVDRGISPIIYLDLEPEDGPNFVLSQEYYRLWSETLMSGFAAPGGVVHFRPAVYLNKGHSRGSWANLNTACVNGSVCVGVSVAHYVSTDPTGKDKTAPPLPPDQMVWQDEKVRPKKLPPGKPNAHIPLLVWQYYENYPKSQTGGQDGDIDPELVNPEFERLVLSGTIVPPPLAVV